MTVIFLDCLVKCIDQQPLLASHCYCTSLILEADHLRSTRSRTVLRKRIYQDDSVYSFNKLSNHPSISATMTYRRKLFCSRVSAS